MREIASSKHFFPFVIYPLPVFQKISFFWSQVFDSKEKNGSKICISVLSLECSGVAVSGLNRTTEHHCAPACTSYHPLALAKAPGQSLSQSLSRGLATDGRCVLHHPAPFITGLHQLSPACSPFPQTPIPTPARRNSSCARRGQSTSPQAPACGLPYRVRALSTAPRPCALPVDSFAAHQGACPTS